MEFRIKGEWSDRDISDYMALDNGGPVDHPLMRKFNMADRNRDRVMVEFDFMPLDTFSTSLGYYQAKSKYKESALGLQESDDQSYKVNLN